MARFQILGGDHYDEHGVRTAWERDKLTYVETDRPLDELFPGKFIRIGEPTHMRDETDSPVGRSTRDVELAMEKGITVEEGVVEAARERLVAAEAAVEQAKGDAEKKLADTEKEIEKAKAARAEAEEDEEDDDGDDVEKPARGRATVPTAGARGRGARGKAKKK
jgi:hypothetical protein